MMFGRMKKKIIIVCAILCMVPECFSQLKFYDAERFPLFGTLVNPDHRVYQRLPDSLKTVCRAAVWHLASNSSGLYVRFASNTSRVAVKWTLKDNYSMNHMAMVGIKGLDLYSLEKGGWQFVNAARPEGKRNNVVIISNMPVKEREFMLYLPLYDGIDSLSIGIDSLSCISIPKVDSPAAHAPVVFYGTSITQGGCASRPGMSYTNILSRKLNRQIINLGFSGNGRLDYEVARVMASSKASCFVIDCVPNCTETELKEKLKPFVAILRRSHPLTPIVLVEGPHFPYAEFDTVTFENLKVKAKVLRAIYAELCAMGDKNVYFKSSESLIGTDQEATVDGIHFTDLGFMRYADDLYPELQKLVR
jgi:lysophospholipase L1-like esterase